MLIEVKVPQLSESVSEATLLAWHKKQGEAVKRDENLIDIETDKVVLELPAPADGVLVKIMKGDKGTVVAGEVIATIDTDAKDSTQYMVYLFQGVVSERARGGGVGAALLQHALAWMRRDGVTRCALHFLAANPSGQPFWTGHGFRPVEHFLTRTVDGRMAWSGR